MEEAKYRAEMWPGKSLQSELLERRPAIFTAHRVPVAVLWAALAGPSLSWPVTVPSPHQGAVRSKAIL